MEPGATGLAWKRARPSRVPDSAAIASGSAAAQIRVRRWVEYRVAAEAGYVNRVTTMNSAPKEVSRSAS